MQQVPPRGSQPSNMFVPEEGASMTDVCITGSIMVSVDIEDLLEQSLREWLSDNISLCDVDITDVTEC